MRFKFEKFVYIMAIFSLLLLTFFSPLTSLANENSYTETNENVLLKANADSPTEEEEETGNLQEIGTANETTETVEDPPEKEEPTVEQPTVPEVTQSVENPKDETQTTEVLPSETTESVEETKQESVTKPQSSESPEKVETPKQEEKVTSKMKKVVEKSAQKTKASIEKEKEEDVKEEEENTAKKVTAKTAYGQEFLTGVTLTNDQGQNANEGTLNYWEKASVNYTWALPDGKVKAGDMMTINLPAQLNFENGVGFAVVDSNGQKVGDATISADKQTLTVKFTDYVNDKNSIKGSLQAFVELNRKVVNTEGKISIPFTNGFIVNTTVVGKGVADLTEQLTKWGNVEGSNKEIKWTIRVNVAKKNLTDLVLVDDFGPNQKFVDDSFIVWKVNFNNNLEWVSQNVITSTKSYRLSGNTVTFNLGTFSDSYVIEYKTLVTGDVSEVTNKVSGTFNGEPIQKEYTLRVEGGSGQAEGYKNSSVILTKVDDTNKVIISNDTRFSLYHSDGTFIKSDIATDENGKIGYENLLPGTYYFVETTAPAGYELDSTPINFTVKQMQGDAAQVTAVNKLIKGQVVLTKTDKATGEKLAGAVFELQDDEGKAVGSPYTTDGNGVIEVKDLAPGKYQFVEKEAPESYKLDTTPVKFEIEKGQKTAKAVSATNEKEAPPVVPTEPEEKGAVVLTKTDKANGEKLTGAVFELQDEKGQTIGNPHTTNSNGVIEVNNLTPGKYQFVETTAPEGYKLDNTPITFEIEKGQTTAKKVTATNEKIAEPEQKGDVVLTKTDKASGTNLAGAVFELQDEKGKTIGNPHITNSNGVIEVKGLALGKYQFVETTAPEGYKLDNTPITFEIVKGQTTAKSITATNEKETPPIIPPVFPPVVQQKGDVVLIKTDQASGEKLTGAVFELQDAEGKAVDSPYTTDGHGVIEVKDLPVGKYQFVEMVAPAGYELDATPITFEIVKGQTTAKTITVTNKKTAEPEEKGDVVLIKTDKASGAKLAGAVFELQDEAGVVLADNPYTTDGHGVIEVKDLPVSKYQFVEIAAPTGYKLDSTPITFEIEKDQTAAKTVTATNEKETQVPPPPLAEKGSITLIKTDEKTDQVLAGAVFDLQKSDGTIVQSNLTTDSSGKITVTDLEFAQYEFVETEAPAGYELDDTPVVANVVDDTPVFVTKTNKKTEKPPVEDTEENPPEEIEENEEKTPVDPSEPSNNGDDNDPNESENSESSKGDGENPPSKNTNNSNESGQPSNNNANAGSSTSTNTTSKNSAVNSILPTTGEQVVQWTILGLLLVGASLYLLRRNKARS